VGPGTIKREAGSRRIAVEGAVVGRDLGTVADEVKVRLADLDLPTGTFLDVGGRVESQERAAAALWSAVAIAVAGVFVLLLLALGSPWEAATILFTLPVALVGGVVALRVTGGTWNVSSKWSMSRARLAPAAAARSTRSAMTYPSGSMSCRLPFVCWLRGGLAMAVARARTPSSRRLRQHAS
jgi:CO/xanthine dehydrogenase Mo-binding subunit